MKLWPLVAVLALLLSTGVAHASTTAKLTVYNESGIELTSTPFTVVVGHVYHFYGSDLNETPQYQIEVYMSIDPVAGEWTNVSYIVDVSDPGVTYSCAGDGVAFHIRCWKTGGPVGEGIEDISVTGTVGSDEGYPRYGSARIRALPSGSPWSTQSRQYNQASV